ncbi:hypothetical protein Tco_0321320 [Tanacetum coccineum]
MDDPNITMEEYTRLEKEKARRRGQMYNSETATYGKIWCNEDVHDLRSTETEFPTIVLNDVLTSEVALSCEPTVIPFNDNQIDFRISFDESDDEDYTVIYDKTSFSYKIISIDDLKTDSENDNDKVNMPSFSSSEPTVCYFDDLDFLKDFEKEFLAISYNNALTTKLDFLTEPTVYTVAQLLSVKFVFPEFLCNLLYFGAVKICTLQMGIILVVKAHVILLPSQLLMKPKNKEITEGIIQNYYDREDGETTPRFVGLLVYKEAVKQFGVKFFTGLIDDGKPKCMTKSSTNELFTLYKDPEREFRSSRRHFKTLSLDELRSPDFNLLFDQEYSEEEEAEAMVEIMEQYMSKTLTDYGLGVARPKIDNKDQFELKGQFL